MADQTLTPDGDKPPDSYEHEAGWIRGHALVRGSYIPVAVRYVPPVRVGRGRRIARAHADPETRSQRAVELGRYAISVACALADAGTTPRQLDIEMVDTASDSDGGSSLVELRVSAVGEGLTEANLARVAADVLTGAGTRGIGRLDERARIVARLLPSVDAPSPLARQAVGGVGARRRRAVRVSRPYLGLRLPGLRLALHLARLRPQPPPRLGLPKLVLPKLPRLSVSAPQASLGAGLLLTSTLVVLLTIEEDAPIRALLRPAPTPAIAGVQTLPTQVEDVITPGVEHISATSTTAPVAASAPTVLATATPVLSGAPQLAASTAAVPIAVPSPVPSPTSARPTGPQLAFTAGQTIPLPWPNDRRSTAWLAADGYHLFVRNPGQFVAITVLPDQLRDVLVNATFRKASGPSGGGYGIVVRDQGPGRRDGVNQTGRYYVIEVGDRREIGMWRRDEDTWVDLLPWTSEAAVRPEEAENTLVVSAQGDRLSLSVNGSEAITRVDAAIARGSIGIFLGGDDNEAVLTRLTIQPLE